VNTNLPRLRTLAAGIAVAVLAVGLYAAPACADDKKPEATAAQKPQPPKEGTREATEAAAKAADDAFNEYQKLCWGGTDEEKANAQGAYDSAMLKLDAAIKQEMPNTKEVREAQDNYNHYEKKYLDPNASVDAHEKARQDVKKAAEDLSKAKREARAKIEAALKEKYHFEEKLSCPKKKGETSGPLDFLGNVSIGVGVGGHSDGHRRGKRHGGCGHGKTTSSPKKDDGASKSGGCGHGSASDTSSEHGDERGTSHEPECDDKSDKKDD
jgi:hypothetical protein